MRRLVILWALMLAPPVLALPLELPQRARQTAARDSAVAQIALPITPYGVDGLKTVAVEGPVTRRAYRIDAQGLTPLQLLAPLRTQLEAAGYSVMLDCNQDGCGGFDFRFAIEVLPAPNMYVNIRAYHFVSAQTPDGDSTIMLLASTTDPAGYLQLITVGEAPETQNAQTPISPPAPAVPREADADFIDDLVASGSAVLHSITFAVGTTTLSDETSPELAELAALLAARPGLQIAVVGHTDSEGGLDANIAVSRARAAAVRTRLVEAYDIDPARVEAGGMGYLAPRSTNLNDDGRTANRRVEVIIVREDPS